jgi:hypothetical protein
MSAAAGVTVDGFAVVDLTAAYGPTLVSSYKRGFVSVSGTSAVLVVDEFVYAAGASPANLTWQLHTAAVPSQAGASSVTLTPAGSSPALLAVLDKPERFRGFAFTNLTTILPDPPFDSAAGQSRVDIVFDDPALGLDTIHVALGSPDVVGAFVSGAATVRPIAEWATMGPVAGA